VLSAASLTHAGKPARVAGAVVQAFGWLMLALGVGFSALLGLVIGLVFGGVAGLSVGGVLALVSLALFGLARISARKLESSGDEERDRRREQALFALAANRAGRLQALEAATALDVTVEEADALLTRLAKQRTDEIDVEIGDQGEIFYTFLRWARPQGAPQRVRIGAPSPTASDAGADAEVEAEAIAGGEVAAATRTAGRIPR
jgi:hypothetical protein